MEGFFGKMERKTGKGRRSVKKEMPIDLMHERRCEACIRNKDKKLNSPKLEPSGASGKKADIYVLTGTVSEAEDVKGKRCADKAGKLLLNSFQGRWKDRIRWGSLVRCRPPKDRPPLPQEIECCRKLQEEDIAQHKPKVVVLVGFAPVAWMFNVSKPGIGAWRGRLLPVAVQGYKCYAYVIQDPREALAQSEGRRYASDTEKLLQRDLATLGKLLRRGLPEPTVCTGQEGNPIKCYTKGSALTLQHIEKKLNKMAKEKVCAIDIETKRLRPYEKDAKMLTVSIATRKQGTIAFPLGKKGGWRTDKFRKKAFQLLQEFLESPIKKVCHNTKFEQEWFAYTYGLPIILNTKWGDTMANAYARDSRKGMLNLGAQTLQYFGFNVKLLSSLNMQDLDNEDLEELLLYNGLDSKWTLELYYASMKYIRKEKLVSVVEERVRTGATLVGAQLQGVPVNLTVAKKLERKLTRLYKKQLNKARKTRAWKKFVKKIGRDPNPDSHPDMVELFDKIMHVKECKTASGGITTADNVLSKLPEKKYPVAPIILEMRSIETVKGTFVDSLPKLLHPDGRLHTSYQHLFTTSSRLSSEDPNLQNWPKHKWKIIREMVQEEGYWVISFDYGQIEARVIAMASQDPAFVQMLWDEYDVHMEWAQNIYQEWPGALDAMSIDKPWKEGGDKLYRQEVKNKWVFPLFFGSNERSVAAGLNLPQDVASYLYREFWSVFEGIKDWQEGLVDFYYTNGYVETLTGKRRNMPCSYNEIINHPIQGTASDIVIDASTRLQDMGIQFNMNVHDDLTFIMANDKKKIKRIAKEMCRPNFDFINVPLLIEVEGGPNWYDQKSLGEYNSDKDFDYH